jgi:uncharacterized spore protein YtfJ
MQHVKDLLGLITGELEHVAQSDAVVGEPLELGEVTVVPLSRISLGFGAGGGQGEGEGFGPNAHGPPGKRKSAPPKGGGHGKGEGGATLGGAKVRPVGVAVFSAEGVEVLPVSDKQGLIDRLFDKVPDLVEKIQAITEGRGQGKSPTLEA